MKRIYLLFAMLLGLFGLTDMSAQSVSAFTPDYDNPIITDVLAQLYGDAGELNPCTDSGEGSVWPLVGLPCPDEYAVGREYASDFWHSDWHHNSQTPGTHYLQVKILDPESLPELIMFEFTRRSVGSDHTTEWSVQGTNDLNAAKEDCEELAYFYTPYSNNTETLQSGAFDAKGYQYLRFYSENQAGDNGARGYFHMTRFQLYPALVKGEFEQAIEVMNNAYDRLGAQQYNFPIGAGPGMYDEDAYNAFMEALDQLTNEKIILSAEDPLAAAEQMVADAEAKLEALKETRNLDYSIPTGYYRIKGAMQYTNNVKTGEDADGNPITESQVVDKFLMGHEQDGKLWAAWFSLDQFQDNSSDIIEGKARSLWRIENKGDGTYDFVNAYKDGRFTHINRSTHAEMTNTADTTLMALDPVYTDDWDGITWVNIRSAKQDANDFFYVHQEGHSEGKGVNGFIVGWSSSFNAASFNPGASEWIFEPVDDAEAAQIIADWAPLKDKDSMIRDIRQMISQAKDSINVAKDATTIKLITEASQFSSPYSQNDLGNADGGNLSDGVLIDGKTDNFWHTYWGGGDVEQHFHYLQVELKEPVDQPISYFFSRRSGAGNDHTTSWSIYGSNNPDADESEWEELMTWDTPYGSDNESFTSEPFDTKGYKYLRIYSDATTNNRGYWHISECQFSYQEPNPTSQFLAMGATATNLEEIVERLDAVDNSDLTTADYDAIKAAYDAFMAKFVNPAALRNAIAAVENRPSIVKQGTDPGYWASDSAGAALAALIEQAKAYDAAGAYTDAQSEKFIADFEANNDLESSAIKVKEGKWYRFRLGTEDEYAENGWSTGGCETSNRTIDGEVIGYYDEAIFGKYAVVANQEEEVIDYDDNGNDVMGRRVVPISASELATVGQDQRIYVDAEEDIQVPDLALFRFVNIGDSAYVIQNKATGLFLSANRNTNNSGYVRLSVRPSQFVVDAIGWGANKIVARDLAGRNQEPLHFARTWNTLETYVGYSDGDGRRGSLFIEEVEDVASDYEKTDFVFPAYPGTYSVRCYPMTVKATDASEGQMWTVASLEHNDNQVTITLGKIETNEASAGRPFIYIKSGEYVAPDDRAIDDEPEYAHFTYKFDPQAELMTEGFLKGADHRIEVGQGAIVFNEDGTTKLTVNGEFVSADGAYISEGEDAPFARQTQVEVVLDETIEDGINAALSNVSRTGNIYTIDGRLVGRGNINSLTQKGVYIINGTKVTVK